MPYNAMSDVSQSGGDLINQVRQRRRPKKEMPAQEVLIPIPISVGSLYKVLKFQQALDQVRRYHKQLSLCYVLPIFLTSRESHSIEILQQLYDYYGQLVCSPIRYSTQLPETPALGQTIFEYAPLSAAALDYDRLTEDVDYANERSIDSGSGTCVR
jgi:nitrogenase subunit NifH